MGDGTDKIVERLLEAGAAPVMALQQSGDRVFLPYLAVAAALGGWVWWRKLRGRVSLFRFLLPSEIWLHRSALFDLRFMVARALLAALVLGPVLVSSAHAATWVHLHLNHMAPVPWHAPRLLGLIGVSLSAFLGEDLARYGLHRLSHRVPALWELHKVHHSAEVLTPFTIYRTHPVEGLIMRVGSSAALALSAAMSAWLFGASLSLWEVLGVHGLSLLWNLTGSNLRHSHIWLRYPVWMERIFVSPAQHQIHHSDQAKHLDRNFGSAFALWDWAFGSLYVPGQREDLRFGLPAREKNHDDKVLSALVAPLVAAMRTISRRKPLMNAAAGLEAPECYPISVKRSTTRRTR